MLRITVLWEYSNFTEMIRKPGRQPGWPSWPALLFQTHGVQLSYAAQQNLISCTASCVYTSLLFVYLADHKDCNPLGVLWSRKTADTYKRKVSYVLKPLWRKERQNIPSWEMSQKDNIIVIRSIKTQYSWEKMWLIVDNSVSKCDFKCTAELSCKTADETILSSLVHEVESQHWIRGLNVLISEFESD